MSFRYRFAMFLGTLLFAVQVRSAELSLEFVKAHCYECHSGTEAEAALDLSALKGDLSNRDAFGHWVKIHDRVAAGEMPPKTSKQPAEAERLKWVKLLQQELVAAEKTRREADVRNPARRLTRAEYENTVRDLLLLDGIPLQSSLPEDGSAHGFDKNADALDISHVNLAKYVEAATQALDTSIATQPHPPLHQKHRFSLARNIYHILMNGDAVMLKDGKPDPAFPPGQQRAHVGPHEHILVARDSLNRKSSVGVFRHEDESFKPYFYDFAAIYPGRYRIKTSFWSFQWDKGTVLPGRGIEAARLSVVQLQEDGRGGGHPSWILGYYDAPPLTPQVHEINTWLNAKDTIGFNTASLAPVANYSRPGRAMNFTGPGIACDWFEIEGPIHDVWPPEGHRRLFGDLPIVAFDPRAYPGVRPPKRKLLRQETQAPNRPDTPSGNWTIASVWPQADADRLLAAFLPRAFRRPVSDEVRKSYLELFSQRMAAGDCFELAMRYVYQAVLCSPDFLYHIEHTDAFDEHALASRLSYFLWNSMPDEVLMKLADSGKLRAGKTLQEETERLLKDPKSQRFIDDFLGQWLSLRKIAANDPDRKLYPEFSPYLQDSMIAETRAYFRELLEKNLDVRHLVKSDFAMLNEKLATLYGIPGVSGSSIRRVPLPADCPRGAFLTQAAVLKVTANGTTTSPVPRGAFVMSRFLGQPPEPPPPNIPAVEPDVQGATTIREQLDKHRSIAVCASCHAKIDPPGFALESFDVIGGLRARYRSIGEGDPAPRGSIDPFIGIQFKLGQPVDSSGTLPNGSKFSDIRQFQDLLAADSKLLLKNLAEQLIVYATGRPVGFGDRAEIDGIVNRTQKNGSGIRTLLHEVVQSKLFSTRGAGMKTNPAVPSVAEVAATSTRTTPPGFAKAEAPGALSAATPTATLANSAEAQERRTVKYRLIGLSTPDRADELRTYLQDAPQLQWVDLDVQKHEITLAYSMARLYPQAPANHKVTDEQLREQIHNLVSRVSSGSFAIKPLLTEPRADLRREEIAVAIPDCKACRLCAYRTAANVDGVEQAEFDAKTNCVVVWLNPAKNDLAPVRAALVKARFEFPEK